MQELILRAERTGWERARDFAASLGLTVLLLASLLPAVYAAIKLWR